MRGTLIATCLQVVHSSAKALGPSGQCCPRKGERLQIFITDALKGIIAMEVVRAHIISRAGVADPSQADRGELALRKGEDVLGRTPTPPVAWFWDDGTRCAHVQLTESLAIGSREASGESCRDSMVRQRYMPPPSPLLFCPPAPQPLLTLPRGGQGLPSPDPLPPQGLWLLGTGPGPLSFPRATGARQHSPAGGASPALVPS